MWLNPAATAGSLSQNCNKICERDVSLYLQLSSFMFCFIYTHPLTLQRLIHASALSQPRTRRAPPLVITAITRWQQLGLSRVFTIYFLLIPSCPVTRGENFPGNFLKYHHHQLAYRNQEPMQEHKKFKNAALRIQKELPPAKQQQV